MQKAVGWIKRFFMIWVICDLMLYGLAICGLAIYNFILYDLI